MRPIPIDLELLGLPGAISTYLLTEPEPLLVDPGPSTTLDRLREGLAEEGLGVEDLRRVLLTHIHLDHAGGTGHLVAENPDLAVHVHEDAAPHLIDPERLVASTRRTFGEAHDRLWGEVRPVEPDRVRTWRPGDSWRVEGLEPHPTPGHIAHHVAFLERDTGILLAGDCMGIVLAEGAPAHPPTPPPSLDPRAWDRTLDRVGEVDPEAVAVAHFGIHDDVDRRRREMREGLRALERRVRRAVEEGDEDDAERYAREVVEAHAPHLPEDHAERHFRMFGPTADWEGMRFWLERNPDA